MNIRRFFSAMLLAAAASAFAQSRDDIRIYIPPVTGTTEQARYFRENFSMEISAAGYTVTTNEQDADYSMKLTVTPNMIVYSDGTQEPAPLDEPQYTLLIDLLRIADNAEIVSLSYNFTELEEMYDFNLYLVYQAMANVPLTKLTTDSQGRPGSDTSGWNTRRLYFGATVFLTPRMYRGTELSSYFIGVGAGLQAEFHLFRYLYLATGAELATDAIAATARFGDEYWNAVLQIPLRLGTVFRPGRFMLQPYIGAAYNIPILPYTTPPQFSWQAGLQTSLKAGPGVFFADLRFSMDFPGKSGLDKNRPHDTRQYDRYMAYLGIGYKFGAW